MQFMQAQQTQILQNKYEMQGNYNTWEGSEERRQQQLDNVIQELGGLWLQFDNFQNYQQPPPRFFFHRFCAPILLLSRNSEDTV
ncbi:hypothetical protein A2U01_0080606, partial [Trifolium medium]|nr:hypothetical protein [Trifolium medium]